MITVAIAQNTEIERGIREALDHLPCESLIRGKLVAVKPNDTWASASDKTGVTQPETLRAVLRFVKRYEPRELVVTGGAGAAETDEVFRIAGLMEVVTQEGATFFDHNRPPFVSVDLPYAPEQGVRGPQRSVMINPRILDYETVIAVNQLKLHETATVTLALSPCRFPPRIIMGILDPLRNTRMPSSRTCIHLSPPWQSAFPSISRSRWAIRP